MVVQGCRNDVGSTRQSNRIFTCTLIYRFMKRLNAELLQDISGVTKGILTS